MERDRLQTAAASQRLPGARTGSLHARPALARALLAPCLALLAACPQETLSLGRYQPDATPEPGSEAGSEAGPAHWPAPDGGVPTLSDAGASSAIALSLELAGRTNITRLAATCAATCASVSLRIEGGVPPYDVRWDDGERGVDRELCIDVLRTRSVAVTDSSNGQNGPASLAIPPIAYEGCGTDERDESWTVCHRREVATLECPETSLGKGLGIDLGEDLPGTTWFNNSFVVHASELYVPLLDVYASTKPCGEDYLYASSGFAPVSGVDPTRAILALGDGQLPISERYLLWYAFDFLPPILPTLPSQQVPLELPADLEVLEAELCESLLLGR